MKQSDARAASVTLVAASRDGRLDAICERFGVRVMSAFGSATRAGDRVPDDLDIGVGFERSGTGVNRDRIGLWTALADLTGFEAVDVVVIDIGDPVLRSEALTGVALYEVRRGEYAEAQIAALGERRDTAWMRRLNLELIAR